MATNKVIGHYWADPYLQASYLRDDGLITGKQLSALRVLMQRGDSVSYKLLQRTPKGTVTVVTDHGVHRVTSKGLLYRLPETANRYEVDIE